MSSDTRLSIRSRRPLPVALIVFGLLGLAGCGKSDPAAPPAMAPEGGASAPAAEQPTQYEVSKIPLETLAGQLEGAPAAARAPVPGLDAKLDPLLPPYFAIRKSLAEDTNLSVGDNGTRLATLCDELLKPEALPGLEGDAKARVTGHLTQIAAAARELASTQNIESQRTSFGRLSTALVYLMAYHTEKGASDQPFIYYCPMKELAWLQDVKSMGNPYYGAKMLVCGDIVPRADGTYRK